MLAMRDANGAELVADMRVRLVADIEMERLFAGYAAALGGAPVPCDLAAGDEGREVSIEAGDTPMAMVEFTHGDGAFWRGLLKAEEVAAMGGGGR